MTDQVGDLPLPAEPVKSEQGAPEDAKARAFSRSPFVGLIAIGSGLIVLLCLIYALGRFWRSSPSGPGVSPKPTIGKGTPAPEIALKTFSSQKELEEFIKSQSAPSSSSGLEVTQGAILRDLAGAPSAAQKMEAPSAVPEGLGGGGAEEFSTTNIQVAGVDEADIVKNDGRYIYLVSDSKIVIVDAYPAEKARVVAAIGIGGTPTEVFINQDRLVVFGQAQETVDSEEPRPLSKKMAPPRYYSRQKAFVKVFDLTDRSDPNEVRDLTIDGFYYDSRMIGDYVYAVIQHEPFYQQNDILLPALKEDGKVTEIAPTDIAYFPIPYSEPRLTSIIAVNTQSGKASVTKKTYLTDNTDALYVSAENVFLVHQRRTPPYELESRLIREVIMPLLPTGVSEQLKTLQRPDAGEEFQKMGAVMENYLDTLTIEAQEELTRQIESKMEVIAKEVAKETQKTVVHRIHIKNGRVQYQAQGEVPGRVLNQFSMDEYQDHFRVATTTDEGGSGGPANHLYVLNQDLAVVGKVEDLAPGETIHSARFMGNRAYLVTFKKTDPLFVIDLKNPEKPKVLGKLKIPGYSDYLHPYDENHLIGIGKEAVEAKEGDFAWFRGVKVALFNVSDPAKPKEISTIEIGDRGTDSEVLQDHKAFLFDRQKSLMVIPILLAEADGDRYSQKLEPSAYGNYVWQGAYVFDISTRGIAQRGRVTHWEEDDDTFLKSGFYLSSPLAIKRSLYMGDTLYTVSGRMVKMNDLVSLDEVNEVKLGPVEAETGVLYQVPPSSRTMIETPPSQ